MIISMIKKALLILMFMPVAAYANADVSDFELMRQAVMHSAKADAYSQHCEKESALAQSFIAKFKEKRDLSKEQEDELITLERTHSKQALMDARSIEGGCKNLDFMMKRFQVMRDLKDVSYLLNGIDPKTVADPTVPDLEALLPPRPKLDIPDSPQGL